jgi:hypothetical protein
MRPESFDIRNQHPILKEEILRHHGIFSDIIQPPTTHIDQEWAKFLQSFGKILACFRGLHISTVWQIKLSRLFRELREYELLERRSSSIVQESQKGFEPLGQKAPSL